MRSGDERLDPRRVRRSGQGDAAVQRVRSVVDATQHVAVQIDHGRAGYSRRAGPRRSRRADAGSGGRRARRPRVEGRGAGRRDGAPRGAGWR
ncbi:MAG: hypothetical protein AVDCRST_MAG38-2277 [uncultured Solirubrobacteraceae bacterium]|uniref:Uncharacterized protein n=1 Tax=uncultured Solirubrobacteraceae bacterium TaxID=1162706 RepID=A0A6J4S327_9ACTN|nr:MAG: hypothetical protein AVDCRST_MAG38-2277 [uncultured Solirubrobacteraceae bacterium]